MFIHRYYMQILIYTMHLAAICDSTAKEKIHKYIETGDKIY